LLRQQRDRCLQPEGATGTCSIDGIASLSTHNET
jgi:hypothetical protein